MADDPRGPSRAARAPASLALPRAMRASTEPSDGFSNASVSPRSACAPRAAYVEIRSVERHRRQARIEHGILPRPPRSAAPLLVVEREVRYRRTLGPDHLHPEQRRAVRAHILVGE